MSMDIDFKIELPQTETTPYVLIEHPDHDKGYMMFKGECYSENVIAFFQNITNWLSIFLNTNFSELTFDCELEYFNSSTSKLLYNILKAMEACAADGKKIIVNWYVDQDNDIMIEHGEDFQDELENLEFNIVKH